MVDLKKTRSFIRVLDEGGLVWKGRHSYRSLDAALADGEAEAGVARWMKQELGIRNNQDAGMEDQGKRVP